MQPDQLFQCSNQGVRYIEDSYCQQDAATIEQLLRNQQQQTFTFNMITNVHMDYMGLYVESTISEVPDAQA